MNQKTVASVFQYFKTDTLIQFIGHSTGTPQVLNFLRLLVIYLHICHQEFSKVMRSVEELIHDLKRWQSDLTMAFLELIKQ